MHPVSKRTREAERIIPNIQRLLEMARGKLIPVVFACDSFRPDDFIFEGKGKPVCFVGTEGAVIIYDLWSGDDEIVLRKRKLSAFFRAELVDLTLRRKKY